MRQDVELCSVGTAVERFYAIADIFGRCFGILDEDIEVSIIIEDAGIQQFEFRSRPSIAVFLDQLSVRIFPLRVFVKHAHVAVRGEIVKVEPVLLRILAVISFIAGEPEHALFENGIAAVPECQSEYEQLIAVADPRNAVLAPAIGLAARLIVRQEIPGVSIRAIVLAYGSPGPVADVRSPLAPGWHALDIGFG